MVKSLAKVLQSDKMWIDLRTVVRAIFPGLIVLRLADQKKPAMDRLYFHVRRMDETLKKSKVLLDKVEKNYKGQEDKGTILERMLYYFTDSNLHCSSYRSEMQSEEAGRATDDNLCDLEDNDEWLDQQSNDEGLLEDDMSQDSFDNTDDNSVTEEQETLGDFVISKWDIRKKKLITDVSIVAWLTSPIPAVREDVRSHDGSHRDAADRLLRKWFGHEVSNKKHDKIPKLKTFKTNLL